MERRLTTILAADVVGYSGLMAADEAGTLTSLKAIRRELIEPKAAERSGRIVKLMGDGTLMEFASVVDALRFAVEVQRALAERNAKVPEDRRIIYRMGINIGDIIVEGEDIYGDGVNIAARLESLAEPGGICVSQSVHAQIKGKVELAFTDLGDQRIKNIPEPVQVFRVLLQPSPADSAAMPTPEAKHTLNWTLVAGGVAILVIAAGIALWQQPWEQREDPAAIENMAFPLPDKPSIAVLPFDNLSGDASQDHFAEGMTDDLITDLSKVAGLFVIARNSTFAYRGQAVEIRKVAEDLGVRYVVEGSVRRAGNTFRVNAQLIDATTGGHVWAERYDGELGDIFAVQDAFVHKIVASLKITLAPEEDDEIGRGQTNQVAAWEAFQKGWEFLMRFNAEDNARAVPYFQDAVRLDPEYGRALAALSLAYFRAAYFYWGGAMEGGQVNSFYTGRSVLKSAAEHPTALYRVASAMHELLGGSLDLALKEADRSIQIDANEPEGQIVRAWALITRGDPDAALEAVEIAIRLNPKTPGHYFWTKGSALFAKSDFNSVATLLERQLEDNPQAGELAALLAPTYVALGRRDDARAVLKLWRPDWDSHQLLNLSDSFALRLFRLAKYQQVRERLFDGLYIAALPAEVTIESLIQVLNGEDLFKRLEAISTVGRFGHQAAPAVPVLISTLSDPVEEAQKRAILALGKIGPLAAEAIPALEALEVDGGVLGLHARAAIQRIAEPR